MSMLLIVLALILAVSVGFMVKSGFEVVAFCICWLIVVIGWHVGYRDAKDEIANDLLNGKPTIVEPFRPIGREDTKVYLKVEKVEVKKYIETIETTKGNLP